MDEETKRWHTVAIRYIVLGLVVVVILISMITVLNSLVWPNYDRWQARLNAQNKVLLNEIQIKQTEQLIQVEKQKAEIRVQDAKGIAESQQIINATLTDRYLQHEAIQAQEKMAGSPNHTEIYIPVGNNGIPLVKTIGDDKKD